MFQVNWGDDTFTVESRYMPGSETYASAGWAPFGAGYAFENMAVASGNRFAYDYVN